MTVARNVVVLYYTRGVFPLRNTIYRHLYCWRFYGQFRYFFVNVAFGVPSSILKEIRIDAIIYHTSFLSSRWSREIFEKVTAAAKDLESIDCLRIAIPQDEFLESDLLSDYLNRIKVDVVLSSSEAVGWPKIYRKLNCGAQFRTVLTGYIDEADVKALREKYKPMSARSIDIGYRAWKPAYWLGKRGQLKWKIADATKAAAAGSGLVLDISYDDKDTISGNDWWNFLGDCRTVIGTTGGASVFDPEREIQNCVQQFVKENPTATFELTREHCFQGLDGSLDMGHRVTPRHLEACMTSTAQILPRGRYSGVLKAGVHYVPVEEDFRDLDRAIKTLHDHVHLEEIATRAYDDIVASGKYTYRKFVEDQEAFFKSLLGKHDNNFVTAARERGIWAFIDVREKLNWMFIYLEVKYPRLTAQFGSIISKPNAQRGSRQTVQTRETQSRSIGTRPSKKLVMLAAHEPDLDPRIKWEANSAAKVYDVVVVGFQHFHGRKAAEEQTRSYKIVRLDRVYAADFRFVIGLLRMIPNRPLLVAALLFWFVGRSVLSWVPALVVQGYRLVTFVWRILRRSCLSVRSVVRPDVGYACLDAVSTGNRSLHRVKNGMVNRLRRWVNGKEDGTLLRELARIYSYGRHLTQANSGLYGYVLANFSTVDIVHCNDFDTLIAGLMLRRHFGCRVIYDAHEFWSHSLATTPQSHTWFFEYLESCFIGKADKVVTVSPMLAAEISRIHRLSQVESVLNCEPWTRRPAYNQRASRNNKIRRKIVFLYQGNFAPQRGLEEFVTAWCQVRPSSAVLFLRGPKSPSRDDIEAKITRSGIDSVFLLPPVTEDELISAASMADVGLIPYKGVNINYTYCCPNKLSQYLHAGLAIVANSLPFVRLVVEENHVGLIYDVNDIKSIEMVIRRFIEDGQELERMKKAALTFAFKEFNWQNEEPKLLAAYQDAVSR